MQQRLSRRSFLELTGLAGLGAAVAGCSSGPPACAALALLLNQGLRRIAVFRSLLLLPYATLRMAVAFVWIWLYIPARRPGEHHHLRQRRHPYCVHRAAGVQDTNGTWWNPVLMAATVTTVSLIIIGVVARKPRPAGQGGTATPPFRDLRMSVRADW